MKRISSFLLGFILLILALTLAGSTGFLGIALVYSFCLYRLFFRNGSRESFALLIGITVAFELFGTHHFGQASGFALIVWGLYEAFAARARFTSLYARYIVAVLLLFVFYSLYFFQLSGNTYRFFWLALALLPVALVSLHFSTSSQTAEYELL